MNIEKGRTTSMYFMLKMNEVSFKKDDELADFKVDNSLLRDSADL